MEVLSDWYLNLRTESDLYRIASDANIDKELVSVDKEPLGINLFLKIKKTKNYQLIFIFEIINTLPDEYFTKCGDKPSWTSVNKPGSIFSELSDTDI